MMGITAYPQTRAAITWLLSRGKGLSTVFREIHGQDHTGVSEPAHGVQILVPPMTSEGFFKTPPEIDYVYAYVPIHGGDAHAKKTMRDFLESLQRLGAELAEFKLDPGRGAE